MADIAIIDYGMGNLRSVQNALQHVAGDRSVVTTSDPETIRAARRVVFPGQGAMPDCMRELAASGAREALLDAARTKPLLGICIGLQMLFEQSEEGPTPGLSLIEGRVRRFASGLTDASGERLKVPHMGWNEVWQTRPHPLWAGISDGARFYFVHSYFADPADARLTVGESRYPLPFTCAIARANIFAVQFHPEKSQDAGLRLLANFVAWDGRDPAFPG
ncbi:glutamine amidotransferase [Burkholderiales bacterium]|nr:MAG: imidazole glycerol phosphate synthase subunit HisH [Burkholderiales bacterium]CAG0955547.1 glutamine amidotransferase [Burkholderiales bacterium]